MNRLDIVCETVLKRIKPKKKEREDLKQFLTKLTNIIYPVLKKFHPDIDMRVEGSIAKDTWLSGDRDIDIFMYLPPNMGKRGLSEILDILEKNTKFFWIKRYAEHPFLETTRNGYRIEFVPCFKVSSIEEKISSVDRTQFHTEWVKKNLNNYLKNQIRLLKQFCKGIGVYGAEIKIGGFSGYLCELLIIALGSFEKLLQDAIDWQKGHLIDIEKTSNNEILKKFEDDALVVIDPIDPKRNVAAALSLQKFLEFKSAAKFFLCEPNIEYFNLDNQKIPIFSLEKLKRIFQERGTDILFVKFEISKIVPDILWGQLYRSEKNLSRFFADFEFKRIRSKCWSDEENLVVMIYEFPNVELSNVQLHIGPPVGSNNEKEFVKKYKTANNVLSGPYIENTRWKVELIRKYKRADLLLNEFLSKKISELGLGKYIREAIQKGFQILLNDEIIPFYQENKNFSQFLTEFLINKPRWLI